MASEVPTLPATARPTRLGGLEKAAILLLTLGPEAAGAVLKCLASHEVHALSAAMARMRTIAKADAAAVQEEAWRWLTARAGYLVDGEQFVRSLLAQGNASGAAPGLRQLAEARGEHEVSPLAAQLEASRPDALAAVLAGEHPQVVAVVLANLPPRQAADVLALLPDASQSDVVQRIAELKTVAPDLLADVGAVLTGQVERLGGRAAAAGPAVGGAKIAADILNLTDKGVEARVFASLDEQAPELAESIRNLMLTFEDLVTLDNREMQAVLKEVAREDLMLALRTASPAMQDKIFRNLSARAAEILKEDMSTMGPVKVKDVEKAQTNIVVVVRRLAEEGKIQLGGSGDDALV